MSTFQFEATVNLAEENQFSIKSYFDSDECVFKKCCEKYKKKKGEHCKKCPKK